jgi:signal transduction histidine kinase
MKLNELLARDRNSQVAGFSGRTNADPLGNRVHDLETILSITRKINTSLILSDVLALVMDHAIRITNAERGFLMLADKEGRLQYVVGQDKNGSSIHPENFQVSESVLNDVYRTGESICIEDALHDERFEQRQSIIDLELQTIMSAPLKTPDATIGVIYVDSRYIHPVTKNEILQLFEILAGQAAITIQNARLYENLKKTYDELNEANDHIIKSERMALRGEMAAEVSHELKNVLAICMLQNSAVQRHIRQGDKGTAEKYVTDMFGSLEKIQAFAENLLVRSSLKSELHPLQLNTLIGKFTIFIKSLNKFRQGKIITRLSDTLPNIDADRDQIQQVLLNLLNNSIEAFTQAEIILQTEYDPAKNMVRLSISDNGPGLDPRVKEKVFAEKVTTKPNGHGFGLPVCRKIMNNHGGEIVVESVPGQGTKFTMTIPASSAVT